MPTISELPIAATIATSDEIPISQEGVARATSVGALLADVQPAIQIDTGTLLGRSSIGPGGPESVNIGAGLVLNNGTLTTADSPLRALTPDATLAATDRIVVSRDGQMLTVPAPMMRSLHAAGTHITINESGTISAVWPTAEQIGANGTVDISTMPRVSSVSATDLVQIARSGSSRSVALSDLLRGTTIDQAAAAAAAGDSDMLWVAQNGNMMSRQTLAGVWTWIQTKLPTTRIATVEISTDTALDGTVHNGRILVCSQPVLLTPILANMGTGFHCEVINLSTGIVTFAAGIRSASGLTTLAAGQSCLLRCLSFSSGNVVYASISNPSVEAVQPGVPRALVATGVTASSISLTWSAPLAGSAPFAYAVEYRVAGSSNWTVAATGLADLSCSVSGLTPSTAYEIAVVASNAGGSSALSDILAASTATGVAVPGQPTNVSATTQGTDTIAAAWSAPSSGGTVVSYTLQYRLSGTSVWANSLTGLTSLTRVVTGLTAGTGYDFRVLAVNSGGTGPASATATATTLAQTGAVTSIQWNLVPVGPYTHGVGAIGVNAIVTPGDAAVRFGFSTSATTRPSSWTAALQVNATLWGAYVATPATAGTWYAWVEGTDGSATTVWPTSFTVQ